jgi:hypothetical protein
VQLQWIKGDKSEKVAFIVANLILLAIWLNFLVRLIVRWNGMAANLRNDIGAFMVFFSFLWITLIRGKKNVFSVAMALMVFVIVSEIVRVVGR